MVDLEIRKANFSVIYGVVREVVCVCVRDWLTFTEDGFSPVEKLGTVDFNFWTWWLYS